MTDFDKICRAYYSFQYSNASPKMGTPGRDLAMLEDKFCKDFNCCGLQLNDMHELLQHFEECHVVIESDDMDEDDDLPFQFEGGQDIEMTSSDHPVTTPFSDMYLSKKAPRPLSGQSQHSVALSDIYQSDGTVSAAFETSVIRKRSTLQPPSPPQQQNPWQVLDSPPQTFPVVLEVPPKAAPMEEVPAQSPGSLDDEKTLIDEKDDRPYKCKIPGCNKAYKNPGGLKYHMHHGHCEDTGDPEMNNIIHKPYQCTVLECGKRYKNLNGLKVIECQLTL